MNNLKDYIFVKGKKFSDNINYYFKKDKSELIISRVLDDFLNKKESDYFLFTILMDGEVICNFWKHKDNDEFKSLNNIYPIIFNLGGITSFCNRCNTIVLKEQITGLNNNKCVHCDLYACKGCKRLVPMIQLDKNRLCERCRGNE